MNAAASLLLLSLFSFAYAFSRFLGFFSYGSFVLLSVSLASLAAVCVLFALARRPRLDGHAAPGALLLAMGLLFLVFSVDFILSQRRGMGSGAFVFLLFTAGLAFLSSLGLVLRVPRFPRAAFYLAVASAGAMLAGTIFLVAEPRIDVLTVLGEGSQTLLAGENVYRHTFPNIYSKSDVLAFYGDLKYLGGLPRFPYPPLVLYLSVPGHLLGDVRVSHLLCLLAVPFLLRGALPSLLPGARRETVEQLSLLPLLYPPVGYLVQNGWTESFMVFAAALFLFFYARGRSLLACLAIGFFVSLKQYTVCLVLPFLFLLRLKDWRTWAALAAVPVATVLPFLLAGPGAMVEDLTGLTDIPLRTDSLSLASYLVLAHGVPLDDNLPFLAVGMLSVGVLLTGIVRKVHAAPPGERLRFLFLSLAILHFAFFFTARHAFSNHYFPLVAFLSILAALSVEGEPSPR